MARCRGRFGVFASAGSKRDGPVDGIRVGTEDGDELGAAEPLFRRGRLCMVSQDRFTIWDYYKVWGVINFASMLGLPDADWPSFVFER